MINRSTAKKILMKKVPAALIAMAVLVFSQGCGSDPGETSAFDDNPPDDPTQPVWPGLPPFGPNAPSMQSGAVTFSSEDYRGTGFIGSMAMPVMKDEELDQLGSSFRFLDQQTKKGP
ncbi:MAG: hypothetical protein HY541_09160 [Deltaproteobacteria bacterium]|nr:hypothetical protein [Deltaproteobacteria bacterium]